MCGRTRTGKAGIHSNTKDCLHSCSRLSPPPKSPYVPEPALVRGVPTYFRCRGFALCVCLLACLLCDVVHVVCMLRGCVLARGESGTRSKGRAFKGGRNVLLRLTPAFRKTTGFPCTNSVSAQVLGSINTMRERCRAGCALRHSR